MFCRNNKFDMCNRFTLLSYFILLITELIYATSMIWVSQLGSTAASGTGLTSSLILYGSLFVASVFLPIIPETASSYCLEKAKSHAINKYVKKFSDTYKSSPNLMVDNKSKERVEPWITNLGVTTIKDSFDYSYILTRVSLKIALNVASVSYALDPRFLAGYLGSFVVFGIVSGSFYPSITKATSKLITDTESMQSTFSLGWNNITVGNTYNLSQWQERFTENWQAYNISMPYIEFLKKMASLTSKITAAVPVAGSILWWWYTGKIQNSSQKLVALITTLPYQMALLGNIETIAYNTGKINDSCTKMRNLNTILDKAPYVSPNIIKQELLSRVDWSKICISTDNKITKYSESSPSQVFDEFSLNIKNKNSGRITICGDNGSGKTTLMSLLKLELKERVFYFPVNANLIFKSTINQNLSQGQRIKAALLEILNGGDSFPENIILLDEWNANLDVKNTILISELLDKVAKRKCIIEVTHDQKNQIIKKVDSNDDLVEHVGEKQPKMLVGYEKIQNSLINLDDDALKSDPLLTGSENTRLISNNVKNKSCNLL